jgi:hypothetical protein
MGSHDQDFRDALERMRKWQWVRHDPDGFPLALGIDLGEVVNRLAMAGQPSPHTAVLSLLCNGHLVAVGDFSWKKFQWGNRFQLEDFNAEVPPNQWHTLQTLIEDERRELANHGWPFATVDLEALGLEDCSNYEWNFGDNRFSTALCPPETQTHDKAYFEEWFSAWNLEIRLIDAAPLAVEPNVSGEILEPRTVGRQARLLPLSSPCAARGREIDRCRRAGAGAVRGIDPAQGFRHLQPRTGDGVQAEAGRGGKRAHWGAAEQGDRARDAEGAARVLSLAGWPAGLSLEANS